MTREEIGQLLTVLLQDGMKLLLLDKIDPESSSG